MKPLNAENILKKYKAGTCSPEEQEIIEHYIFFVGITPQDLNEMENEFDELKSRIEKIGIKPKQHIGWPLRIAGIAAAVAAIVFGVWFYNTRYMNARHPELVSGPQYQNDVAPGKNTATLTLPNGETINLSDVKTGVVINCQSIIYSDGSLLRSSLRGGTHETNSGQAAWQPHDEIASIPRNDGIVTNGMLTASTPRGGQYRFTLPDGTQVWLNADSKISFPSQFSGKERKILLSGEAYFEVTKDKKRPFIVTTDQQTVEVLGTHFNINAYAEDKSTTTTLLEGSVRVSPKEHHPGADRDGVVLKPNQQSALAHPGKDAEGRAGNKMQVKNIDPDEAIAWKNGEFAFNNEPLSSITPRLARWYDVEISYQNNEIKNKRLNGTISKFGKISEILSMLEITGEVHFKIEGRRITVMP